MPFVTAVDHTNKNPNQHWQSRDNGDPRNRQFMGEAPPPPKNVPGIFSTPSVSRVCQGCFVFFCGIDTHHHY